MLIDYSMGFGPKICWAYKVNLFSTIFFIKKHVYMRRIFFFFFFFLVIGFYVYVFTFYMFDEIFMRKNKFFGCILKYLSDVS